MKKVVPIILLLLLLSGCAEKAAANPTPELSHTPGLTTTALPSQSPVPTESIVPSVQKTPPDWQYDLTLDGVFRTDQNTGDIVQINNSDYPSGIIITEDWVYYCDENKYLYRMDNENTKELLVSEESWPLHLSGNILYYLTGSGLNRMNVDGSEKEHIFDCDYTDIEMTDTYIFYTIETPESKEYNDSPGAEDGPWFMGELHRIGLDGQGDVKVADLITELCAYNNTVYYADFDTTFYSLNPETLEKTSINNVVMADDVHFAGGYIFFLTHRDRCYYRLSQTDGTLTMLASGWPNCRGILDGYVYIGMSGISPDEDGLYRIKVNGVVLEKVK